MESRRPAGVLFRMKEAVLYRFCACISLAIVLLALSQINGNAASADLLAYEGFDYPKGSFLKGQSGGTGWSNAWVDVSGNVGETITAGSIARDKAPVGYDNRSVGNAVLVSNSSRCGRWLDCSASGPFARAGLLDANGDVGEDGKTLYVSFLQQPNSEIQFYEFEFHRNDLGDPGRIAGIGNDVPNSTQVHLRAPAGTHTPLGVGNTNVNFYVVRIDYKSGNDDVYVYRNPTGNLESDNEPVLTMVAVADMSFDGISMGAYLNGVTVNTDEIRIGQTWASVLGDPPVFVLQPTNKTVYAREAFTLNSVAQSSLPLSYQWYQIAAGTTNALPNATNLDLSFSAIQFNDAGQYFVTASNGLGLALSSIANVAVQPLIVAVTSAANVPIGIGSNLVINATVNGAAPMMLQWYKDGQPVPLANGATLALTATTAFDVGQYVLVASNSYGGVTSSIVNVFPNTGGLLAYEGFDYGQSGSDIGGRNGGFGWAGSWQNLDGGSSQSSSNNLSAGASAPSGYDARSSGGSLAIVNNSRKGRFLDCSATGNFALYGYINSNGDIGADGKSLYLSFLQQPNGTSLFYEFELHRKDLGDGGRMGGFGNDTGDSDVHLRVESPPGGASSFWSLGPGNTGVNFYVVRIDFKPGNDDVFVYRNPTSLTEPATPTVVVSNVADLSFDGVSFGAYLNSRTVSHDEVRLGATWGDVIGIANPLRLRLTQRANNLSHLLLAGAPNYTYQIQATSNIAGPWTNVGAVPLSSLGTGQFAETNPTDPRYYRATNSLAWTMPPSSKLIIADFEQPNYGAWVTTGTAFGPGPAQGTLPNQQTVSGYQGSGLVNTYYGGDTSTGTLTSPPFVITKPYINFLIGGGGIPGQECMNLIISNVAVRTATGANNEALAPQQWDVSAYLGQTASIQIVDLATGAWGHINIDQITLSDTPLPPLTRDMLITNSLLNLPVQNSASMRRITVAVGGIPVRDFNIRLSTGGTADWWAFVDVSAFTNQPATLSASSVGSMNDGFYSIVQTNGIVDGTNLYQEPLRPQLHFSTKRGWLNDANGMVCHNGKYHLYYQHDPFDWGGTGQKWWGHAVSSDMVNWVEMPEGLYSHSYGDQVYSGSAVVDTNNTSGFKTGTNDVIVAAFTSTARGECIVYSNDGGLTFVEITNNPVVVHSGRDPHLFWYAPSNYWVMALYDASGGDGIAFYSSPNFRQWTYRSKINGYFECPDMFQLPVDGNTNNMMWLLCDASSGYQIGQFDGVTFTPSTSKLPGNSGNGFYASQTFTSMPPGDKRLVRIGWAQISTPAMPFNQLMYFPTELTLRTLPAGVRLCSQPVAELANLSINDYAWTNLTLSAGSNPLSGIRGSLLNLRTTFVAGTAHTINFSLQAVSVVYNVAAQQITCNGKTNSLVPSGGIVQLQILVDRDTVEIFGNDGELYMPLSANNSSGNSLVSVTCSGGSAIFNSLVVSKLKSIWPRP
jgi:fructan beta-fructosidase